MCIIDAGHYGVEHIFMEDVKHIWKKVLTGVHMDCVGCEASICSYLKNTLRPVRYGLLAVYRQEGVPYMRQIIVEGQTLDVKGWNHLPGAGEEFSKEI